MTGRKYGEKSMGVFAGTKVYNKGDGHIHYGQSCLNGSAHLRMVGGIITPFWDNTRQRPGHCDPERAGELPQGL